jgi:hypothetical protein
MSGPEPQPPPEEPYQLPGTVPAWSQLTLPDQPLTAAQAAPFVSKLVG